MRLAALTAPKQRPPPLTGPLEIEADPEFARLGIDEIAHETGRSDSPHRTLHRERISPLAEGNSRLPSSPSRPRQS